MSSFTTSAGTVIKASVMDRITARAGEDWQAIANDELVGVIVPSEANGNNDISEALEVVREGERRAGIEWE